MNGDNTPTEGPAWRYEEAFGRNRGIISKEEQDRLRNSRVAIVGMGGVGGINLVTLARLGIGRFTIADPDIFELANTNRQFGAMCSTMGCSKAEVMANIARDINPDVDVRVFSDPISSENADDFLRDADVFVDAIDFYAIDVRRMLFRMVASRGIYGITAGPVGFSAIWILFEPDGMSFDRYFDMSDEMSELDKIVAFVVGVAPKATHTSYMDLNELDTTSRTGPSTSIGCHIAGGAVSCEAVRVLLGKGRIKPAPYYHQFDPFVGCFKHGRLWSGNRHPLQRIKRWGLKRFLQKKLQGNEVQPK